MNKTLLWFVIFYRNRIHSRSRKSLRDEMHSNFDSIEVLSFNWTFVRGKYSLFSVPKLNRYQWRWSFCTSQWPRRYSTLAFPPQQLLCFIIYSAFSLTFIFIIIIFFERERQKKVSFYFFHFVVISVSLSCISSTFEDFFALDFEMWIVFLYLFWIKYFMAGA